MSTLWSYLATPKTAAPAEPEPAHGYTLRPYQRNAVDCILAEFAESQSTLAVLATGLGKTVIAAHVSDRMRGGRVLFLAHREELVLQAARKLEDVCGEAVDIEKGDQWADEAAPARIVVSSIQTQIAVRGDNRRMHRFRPDEFALVIIDEAHHATASSYTQILDYYRQNPALRVLGLTATPNRSDEKALGRVFQSCAFQYELQDAIPDGWLVPLRVVTHELESLDLAHISTTAGDLNGGELAEEMERDKNVAAVVPSVLSAAGDRKTLVFASSVRHAELLCDLFNGHKPNSARTVDGKTPAEERRRIFRDYAAGRFQILCNCAVATEGFDEPGIEVVAIARPTKSLPLYQQIIGRGTRPLPGTVDGLPTDVARRNAIAASAKPFLTVLDYKGNAGRHKLVRAADVLGGKYEDEIVERAQREIERKGKEGVPADVAAELERAKAEYLEEKRRDRERREKIRVKAKWQKREVDPFDVLDITPVRERGWSAGQPATDKQIEALKRMKFSEHELTGLTKAKASQLIGESFRRREQGLSSFAQIRLLQRFGVDAKPLTFEQASAAITTIKNNGWRLPKDYQAPPVETHEQLEDLPW